MKASDNFKKTIQTYLENRALEDALFAERLKNEKKSFDECCNFILNTVKESGCVGFDDDEIYSIAVHYWDEENLDPKYLKDIKARVVVNQTPKLTAEDMAKLEEKAREDFYQECLRKQRESLKPKKKVSTENIVQGTLFD